MTIIIKHHTYNQQDSKSVPESTEFDQQVSNSFPEFEDERERYFQNLVSSLET